jgi:hypothetical protein
VRAAAGGLTFGTGWFPPEGGRRRQWIWTSGDAVLAVPPGRTARCASSSAARPAEPVTLTITDEHGDVLAEHLVTPDFRVHRLVFPDAVRGTELHFSSPTFVPARAAGVDSDRRTLGVAVSRMRMEGATYGPREVLAHRFPWLLRDPSDLSFLSAYDVVMANSEYTRGWVRSLWDTEARCCSRRSRRRACTPRPCASRSSCRSAASSAPGLGHAKRQLEMVEWFGQALRSGALPRGWRMHVVGGCEESQRPYLAQVRRPAPGCPVEVVANAPRAASSELLSTASVFWSATGYGEDEQKAPWASEHFGMTTVEAMAGGCVPGRHRPRRAEGDRARGRRRLPLVDARAARRAAPAASPGDEALRARLGRGAAARPRTTASRRFADRWREIAAQHDLLEG